MGIFSWTSPSFEPVEEVEAFKQVFKTRKIYSLMVDLRSAEAFEADHLKAAIHVPMGPEVAEQIVAYLDQQDAPRDVLLFVYAGRAEGAEWLESLQKQARKRPFRKRVNAVYYLSKPYVSP